MLTPEQKKKLLALARGTLENYLKPGRILSLETYEPAFLEKSGAFVTLKVNNELRGCIGRISAESPLYRTIQEMTIEAAVNDPRFLPVSKEELEKIEIEISVLSELKMIKDADEIEAGKHGIFIRQGFRSGLLLPQVATEYNWGKEEFLMHTCLKAGLPAEAWKRKDTQVYIFSAQVFSEKETCRGAGW
jgi:AmmeMemoRadiSam system protein A